MSHSYWGRTAGDRKRDGGGAASSATCLRWVMDGRAWTAGDDEIRCNVGLCFHLISTLNIQTCQNCFQASDDYCSNWWQKIQFLSKFCPILKGRNEKCLELLKFPILELTATLSNKNRMFSSYRKMKKKCINSRFSKVKVIRWHLNWSRLDLWGPCKSSSGS